MKAKRIKRDDVVELDIRPGFTQINVEIFDSGESTGDDGYVGCSWIKKVVIEVINGFKITAKYEIIEEEHHKIDGVGIRDIKGFSARYCNEHKAAIFSFYPTKSKYLILPGQDIILEAEAERNENRILL